MTAELRGFCRHSPEAVFFGGIIIGILTMLALTGVAFASTGSGPQSDVEFPHASLIVSALAVLLSGLSTIILALIGFIFVSHRRDNESEHKAIFSILGRKMDKDDHDRICRFPGRRQGESGGGI